MSNELAAALNYVPSDISTGAAAAAEEPMENPSKVIVDIICYVVV
jgi:hypothetical protein